MAPSTTLTPDPATDKPPQPRRWIPLPLKMFVVILVLLGVGSSLWIGADGVTQHTSIYVST